MDSREIGYDRVMSQVDSAWGRRVAHELLQREATMLSSARRKGQWHIWGAREFACLAEIGGFDDLRVVACGILRAAPDSAFTAGVITNIEDLSQLIRRAPPTLEDANEAFPEYTGDVVESYVRRCGIHEPLIGLALQGRLEEAGTMATEDVEKENIASTCAVLGQIGAAISFVAREEFPSRRRPGPLMVACIESYRHGDKLTAEELLHQLLAGPAHWGPLAAGFLGRIPWGGYPLADY